MNVIIVAKFLKAPKKLSSHDPRVIVCIAAGVALLLGLGTGIGLLLRGANAAAMDELHALRAEVDTQQAALEDARRDAEREVNALAVRVAELQATANRLNALGERLTRLGQLEEGEFDFAEAPGVGGPHELYSLGTPVQEPTLTESLDALDAQFAVQEEQLQVLESLILDRDLDQSLTPSGRPVRVGYASSAYGYRADPFTGKRDFHRGMDFTGQRGSDVLTVADGVVSFSGKRPGYGNVVDIDHGNGFMTRYAHNQENLVQIGHRVRAGDVIAKMGSTGRSTAPHVHFEVWKDDKPVNPYSYLKSAKG